VALALSSAEQLLLPELFLHLGCKMEGGKPQRDIATVDFLLLDEFPLDEQCLGRLKELRELGIGIVARHAVPGARRLLTLAESEEAKSGLNLYNPASAPFLLIEDEGEEQWSKLRRLNLGAILYQPTRDPVHQARRFFDWLRQNAIALPVLLSLRYGGSKEDLIISAAMESGALFCDGLGEGLLLQGPIGLHALRVIGFNILQAARLRSSKTEFISCPGCGRTLFNLQEVSEKIRQRTAHLPGVKIAIMGCIVNGPGEMADADFGYVGSRPEMIDLYVGKECVERNIPFNDAPDRLVDLIKRHGRWLELA
jgi:(E)-4-hydroxy-3-methylbut-2-enyl-diphosphate synthase